MSRCRSAASYGESTPSAAVLTIAAVLSAQLLVHCGEGAPDSGGSSGESGYGEAESSPDARQDAHAGADPDTAGGAGPQRGRPGGDATCAADGFCNQAGCAGPHGGTTDPDCQGPGPCDCDWYDWVCEASARCSSETCACDADCHTAGVSDIACTADSHCDTWCPTGVDPDCGGAVNEDCAPGPTSGDYCGEESVACPDGVVCPPGSTCYDVDCVCPFDKVWVNCEGVPCSADWANCPDSNVRCITDTISNCGAGVNVCTEDGGLCPGNSSCDADWCSCPPGSTPVDCAGNPCAPDCPAGEWKCACVPNCANKQCGSDGCGGSCGQCDGGSCSQGVCTTDYCGDEAVTCSNGTKCYPGSECNENGCGCPIDKMWVDCEGAPCTSTTCSGTNKRCVADTTSYCGNGKKKCDDGYCPNGSTCGGGWCSCPTGKTAVDCAGNPCSPNCPDGAWKCACIPSCANKQCGSDGCGGSCGSCGPGQACSPSGTCACVPNCSGKTCGPDGCGGVCGPNGGGCGSELYECSDGVCKQVKCYTFASGPCTTDSDCCEGACCITGPYAHKCQCAKID